MSAEERARAFDRFWLEGEPGSGLGLPIVKRLSSSTAARSSSGRPPGGGLDVVLRLRPGP